MTQSKRNAKIKVAGIQFAITDDMERNVDRARDLLKLAHDEGARVAAFAELFYCPWFPAHEHADPAPFAQAVPGPLTDQFSELARLYETVLVLPICERAGRRFFNSAVVIDADGSILGAYRKVHLPRLPLWYEKDCFSPGDGGVPVFETRYLTIGVQICWDNFFPEGSRVLGLRGADLIVCPTAAAMRTHDRWQTAIAANAITNGLYCLRVNRTGSEEAQDFYGETFAIDPDGELMGEPAGMNDSVSLFEADLAEVEGVRELWPFYGDRRPEVYRRGRMLTKKIELE
jgi:agmatine deiminase